MIETKPLDVTKLNEEHHGNPVTLQIPTGLEEIGYIQSWNLENKVAKVFFPNEATHNLLDIKQSFLKIQY